MRGMKMKVLVAVGAVVVLAMGMTAPALAQVRVQATINCPKDVSYILLTFALEDNNSNLWGVVDSPQGVFVNCTGVQGANPLDVRKTGTAANPQRVDKFGISYYCAPGLYPNTRADAVRLMAAAGGKPNGEAGSLATVPGKIKLPCPHPQVPQGAAPAEIVIEVGAVPTLTEWGLIALAVLLAGSLAFMIRRRLAPRPAGA